MLSFVHFTSSMEFTFSLFILSLTLFSLTLIFHFFIKKTEHLTINTEKNNPIVQKPDPVQPNPNLNPTQLTQWAELLEPDPGCVEIECVKRKKKKNKNKKKQRKQSISNDNDNEELVCFYPFTTSSSVTQRKIKDKYDELVKSHGSKGLTLAQVGQFVNCLVDAQNGLKHKSEVIQRKFTITKALLLNANRSSFDRLSQQINKLELEQKRLEEDAFVYNWLQQQLKISPAYKKMVEIGMCMELKAKTMELAERTDDEFSDISFEELLEQEKKDSFWLKNGKPRSCSG